MKKIAFLLATAALPWALSSCGPGKKAAQVEYVTMEPITVSAKDNPLDIYRVSVPRYWDITHTRAALSFNLQARSAEGRAWLDLEPYFYATDSLVLDAKTMRVDSVVTTNNGPAVKNFRQREDQLIVHFARTVYRGEPLQLYIRYTSTPYAAAASGGSAAIRDDRGLYFINSRNEVPHKPVQIWTQGETHANSHWLPTLDQPNERFTVQLEITVPDSFVTLSNGSLTGSKKQGNLRTDFWEIDKPIQTYAIMMAIGNFAIVQDTPWEGKEISYYVEPEYAPYAKKMFNNTPEMVDFFSKITGVPYPWSKYSQIVVRDYVSGAMENTTASLFGEFMNQDFREINDKNYEDIVSHELFHQWFGDYVTAESWSNLTVNESFANYGEQLWRKYKYGRSSNDELALNDLNLYLNQSKFNDAHLVRFHYHAHEEMFDRISYQKGGAILRYLHALIGDSAFYRAMNIYLTQNALQAAEATHWRLAVEEATGTDWNWFFNQWYYRGGHPVVQVTHQYDDVQKELKVTALQIPTDSGAVYELPLKAALVYGATREVFDWKLDHRKQTFTYPYKNDQRPVFIPDHESWLVGILEEKKPHEAWLTQFRHTDDYINKRKVLLHAQAKYKDSIPQVILHDALKDTIPGVRVFALTVLAGIRDQAIRNRFASEVEMLAISDPENRVRAGAFKVLGSWKVVRLLTPALEAVTDSSYMVAGAALEALRKTAPDTAYVLAKAALQQGTRAEHEAEALEVIALAAKDDDIAIYEATGPYAYGTRKLMLSATLRDYLYRTGSLNSFERGLQLLEAFAASEAIKPYRSGVGLEVFALGRELRRARTDEKSSDKLALLESKIKLTEQYGQKIMDAETDEENLKKYRQASKR